MTEIPDYKCVHNTHFHHARLLKRNKCIASARNTLGTRSRGSGYSDHSLHAERAVVKRIGDISQLRGCVLVVVRVNRHGQLLNSKPCSECEKFLQKCMSKYGLRKVVYSSSSSDEE